MPNIIAEPLTREELVIRINSHQFTDGVEYQNGDTLVFPAEETDPTRASFVFVEDHWELAE